MKTTVVAPESQLIDEFGTRTLDAIQSLLHDGCENYLDEVYLFKHLGERLTSEGWTSRAKRIKYSHISGYPDLQTSSPDGSVVITTEGKYFVLDWPTRVAEGTRWDGSIARQHLGIIPGKKNNAAHDIRVKLPGVTVGTHISFILVRFALASQPGDVDLQEMLARTGIDQPPWRCFTRDWAHPRDNRHRIWVYHWCRRLSSV